MESPQVEVKKTALGNALFATADFEAGQEIGIVEGQLIADPEYGSDYCIALDEHTSLEPQAPFRFLNHSCEPNCELLTWEDEEACGPRLAVYSLVPIQAGCELTIDYAWPADAAINCLCGAATCRGWVVSVGELASLKSV